MKKYIRAQAIIPGKILIPLTDIIVASTIFQRNFIRIPETELLQIRWGDVCDDDDQSVRAAKMAKALVNSSQRIIKPDDTVSLHIYTVDESE